MRPPVEGPMTAAVTQGTTLPAWAVAKIWLRHLTSLVLPGLTLGFLWTGPHRWYVALLFILPLVLVTLVDTRPLYERRQPAPSLPAWPFDALVYLLVALQLVIILETARFFSNQGVFSIDMMMVLLVVGGSSGFSIITAHELIHRKDGPGSRSSAVSSCARSCTSTSTPSTCAGTTCAWGRTDDPATARFGEGFEALLPAHAFRPSSAAPGSWRSSACLDTDMRTSGDRRHAGKPHPARTSLVETGAWPLIGASRLLRLGRPGSPSSCKPSPPCDSSRR